MTGENCKNFSQNSRMIAKSEMCLYAVHVAAINSNDNIYNPTISRRNQRRSSGNQQKLTLTKQMVLFPRLGIPECEIFSKY